MRCQLHGPVDLPLFKLIGPQGHCGRWGWVKVHLPEIEPRFLGL